MKRLCVAIAVALALSFWAGGAALAEGKNGGTSPTGLDLIACQAGYNTCLSKCDQPGPFGPGRNATECKNKCDLALINCQSPKKPARSSRRPTKPPNGIEPTKPVKPIESGKPIRTKR
jgi:hypothetical protein